MFCTPPPLRQSIYSEIILHSHSQSRSTSLFLNLPVFSFPAFDTFSRSSAPSVVTFFCPSPFISLCLSSSSSSSLLCCVSRSVVSHHSQSILSCTNVEPSSIHKLTDSSGVIRGRPPAPSACLLPGAEASDTLDDCLSISLPVSALEKSCMLHL